MNDQCPIPLAYARPQPRASRVELITATVLWGAIAWLVIAFVWAAMTVGPGE